MRLFLWLLLLSSLVILLQASRDHLISEQQETARGLMQVTLPSWLPPFPDLTATSTTSSSSSCGGGEETPDQVIVKMIPLWGKLLMILALILLSGLFSGLTLGVLGLDVLTLKVLVESGSRLQRLCSRFILPLRKRGNLLLVTLLLGNVAVNALLSILLAELTSSIVGFLLSTGIIVIFGEIIPQATCSRHGLLVGFLTLPVIYCFLILLLPLSLPLAIALNLVLGHEVGNVYSKEELGTLIELHAKSVYGGLDNMETTILQGTLDFSDKEVREVMTVLDNVYMLEINACLDYQTLSSISSAGHSRIPVYEGDRQHIVSILLAKDLILLNPEEAIPVSRLMHICGREVVKTFPDTRLDEMLTEFKRSRTHLAIVHDVIAEDDRDPYYVTLGLITLEDIIEEIIQDEIIDETDAIVDNVSREQVEGRDTTAHSLMTLLRTSDQADVSDHSQHQLIHKHEQLIAAAKTYLQDEESELFGPSIVGADVLDALLKKFQIVSFHAREESLPPIVLYAVGSKTMFATLLLEGSAVVDDVVYDAPCLLNGEALVQRLFVAPTTVTIARTSAATVMRLGRIKYETAIRASEVHAALAAPVTTPVGGEPRRSASMLEVASPAELAGENEKEISSERIGGGTPRVRSHTELESIAVELDPEVEIRKES